MSEDQPSDVAAVLLGMERAALDRWGKGDPSGFLEICAPDVVYFDPWVDRRIDGLDALTEYYQKLRGKIWVQDYRLIDPRVQLLGDVAVLTFHYVSRGRGDAASRWNCTEVYRKLEGKWRIVQTHWSLTGAGSSD